jgi:hypothetical protein
MKYRLFAVILASIFASSALADPSEDMLSGDERATVPEAREGDASSIDTTSFCFTLFQPTGCHAVYGGESYFASGSNQCVAIRNLVKEVNGRYLWFIEVRSDDLQDLRCEVDE